MSSPEEKPEGEEITRATSSNLVAPSLAQNDS